MQNNWRSRGYLPHYHNLSKTQFISFHLAYSITQKVLRQAQRDLADYPEDLRTKELYTFTEDYLDKGYGSCALAHPQVAQKMQNALLYFHEDRYELVAWCIMPNHVHTLIRPCDNISKIVQSWKSYVGKWALQHNQKFNLNFPAEEFNRRFWQHEYWDRFVRDEKTLTCSHQIHS